MNLDLVYQIHFARINTAGNRAIGNRATTFVRVRMDSKIRDFLFNWVLIYCSMKLHGSGTTRRLSYLFISKHAVFVFMFCFFRNMGKYCFQRFFKTSKYVGSKYCSPSIPAWWNDQMKNRVHNGGCSIWLQSNLYMSMFGVLAGFEHLHSHRNASRKRSWGMGTGHLLQCDLLNLGIQRLNRSCLVSTSLSWTTTLETVVVLSGCCDLQAYWKKTQKSTCINNFVTPPGLFFQKS